LRTDKKVGEIKDIIINKRMIASQIIISESDARSILPSTLEVTGGNGSFINLFTPKFLD